MSLASNAQNVVFASQYPVDKIVGVWEGSYNRATQVTSRSYTYLGSPYNVYFYRIPHGFTRPVFCDLLWSSDGITYSDNLESIAFSDSTYIYIYDSQGAAAAGTGYYKVIAFWIDSYDSTNPLVPSYLSSNKTTSFDSRLNYQKIYDQGVINVTNPTGATTGQVVTHAHGLNRLPNHRVYFEAFSGEVWPAVSGGASNIFLFADNEAECEPWMTSTDLNMIVTLPASTTRKVWYRIYWDT